MSVGLVPRGEPLRLDGGVPVYDSGAAPAGLRTKTQLGRRHRLKLAPGQLPVAYVLCRYYARGYQVEQRALFDPADAVKMKPLASKRKAEMEARRRCPVCSLVRGYIVRGGRCEECRDRAEAAAKRLRLRTCEGCRRQRLRGRPFPVVREGYGWRRLCVDCRRVTAAKRREADARWLERVVVCGEEGCAVRVATLREARAFLRATPRGYWAPRWCPPCVERREAEFAAQRAEAAARCAALEARWAAEEEERRRARAREVGRLEAWAAEVLDDPKSAVLDCETTGLEGDARIVDLAVVTVGRETLLDSLVDPGVPIPADAERIHGIGDAMVAGAPPFGDLVERLGRAVAGRRVLIYNKAFDVARLRHELTLYYLDQVAREAADWVFAAGEVPEGLRERAVTEALARVEAWMGAAVWEDVMVPYSNWVGEWSEYHGNYRWQRLNGGHRALGDCLAVVDRLEEVAGRGRAGVPGQGADGVRQDCGSGVAF
ncbi:exonuclease domain-containing protein [Kitasatospora sp. NPDC087861]|uniref:exonuclease domain-containing protein n=1 Tax=Kitasatospora sp. NPDC087861 TaxID=3364070 RepID=UPI0037F97FAF